MVRKSKKNVEIEKRKAGLTIIFVGVVCFIVLFFSGGIWVSNINWFGVNFSDEEINSGDKFATIEKEIDVDNLFDSMYYVTLDMLSNSVALGTNWLSICPNITKNINNRLYYKTCDDSYKVKNDVTNYLKKYVSSELADKFMDEYYIDYNNELYVIPFSMERDDKYDSVDSYNVVKQSSDKIIYGVKSAYKDPECLNNCKYTYKTNKFVLEKINNRWVVSEIEMPY